MLILLKGFALEPRLYICTVEIKYAKITLEVPDSKGGVSRTQPVLLEFENREGLRMTLELVLAAATIISCIAAVASAVVATLSYLKNKKS